MPVIILIACWSLLYLPNLRTSPGWYGDETLTHHTSLNLASGKSSNLALYNTFWHPHYPYQPAYSLVNGIFARIAGGDIIGSRFFNSLLALAAAFSIFILGRRSFGVRAAYFSALMFLTYTQTIIHFRMSYAHNAAGLGLLLMTLFLLRHASKKNDWLAGVGLMIAAGSHPLFVHGAVSAFLSRLLHPRSWFRMAIPSAIYLIASMGLIYFIFGNWLLEDLAHLKATFSSRGDQDGGGVRGLQNFWNFISQDWYHLGMLAGLLMCLKLRKFAAPLVGILVLFLLVRNRQNLVLFYYQAIVILPVLCLGWAGLWRFCETQIRHRAPRVRGAVHAFWLLPTILFLSALPLSLKGSFMPRNQYWVTQSTSEVEAAAKWLNERTTASDVVAGNANIAWLLKAQTSPYLQMITWYGYPTQGYENGNQRERFRFDASLENSKYAVIGDIDKVWTFHEPNVAFLLKKKQSGKWTVVWEGEYYTILQNPRFPSSP